VLILDEAHHLDPDTLEQIRLLSNFESPTQKHLQILLVGQPELKAKLALPELRQLQQRITLRAVISPLSSQDIGQYIRRRLQTAGARDLDLFTERAIGRIAAYAGGIPRIVNMVCEHGLLIGYAHQRRRLGEPVAERAIRYLEDGAAPQKARNGINGRRWLPRRRSNRLLRIGIGLVSLVALVTTILLLWPRERPGQRLFGESLEVLVEDETERPLRGLSPEAPRAEPAAVARPAETWGSKLVSSPRTAPASRQALSRAPARSAATTPAPARFEEAPWSRVLKRPQPTRLS
jgi:hypothetical protein